MPVEDLSLLSEIPEGVSVLKQPIWEPYDIYKKLIGRKKSEKINTGFLTEKKQPGLLEKFSVWVRGNFFIPDARKFWIRPSIKFLTSYIHDHPIDAIVSTGPPHSMHLIALGVKANTGLPWLADFRDPWTNIDYYNDLLLTNRADMKHHKLERDVLTSADSVVAVGKTLAIELEQLGGNNVSVITNGYDEADTALAQYVVVDKKFSIVHVGTLVRSRNCPALWRALGNLVAEHQDFADDLELRLVGKCDLAVLNSIKENGLDKFLTRVDHLPHDEVIAEQRKAAVLLLLINNSANAKGILTGKFFEYMAAGRPMLAAGPRDGDVAHIMAETNCGEICEFDDHAGMQKTLLDFYLKHKKGTLRTGSEAIDHYAREPLTARLAEELNRIVEKVKA